MPVPQRCPGPSDRHSWRDGIAHDLVRSVRQLKCTDRVGMTRCASDKGGYEGCLIKSRSAARPRACRAGRGARAMGAPTRCHGPSRTKDPVDRRGDLAGIHQCFHGKLCGRIGLFKGEFADSLSGTHHDIMTCRSLEEGGNHAADTPHPNDDDTRSLIHLEFRSGWSATGQDLATLTRSLVSTPTPKALSQVRWAIADSAACSFQRRWSWSPPGLLSA